VLARASLAPPTSAPRTTDTAAGRGMVVIAANAAESVVSRLGASSPLRLLTPRNHGHAAWVYTSTYGGGLVDGDHIRLDVQVGSGAAVFLSTQSATKAYRSPRGTSSELLVRAEDRAVVISAPDPVMCFAGARYRQAQAFELAPTASLVAVDAMVSGRYARGERWSFTEYASRTTLHVGGRLIVHDALILSPADGSIERRMGRFDALATVIVIGPACEAVARGILAESAALAVGRRPDLLIVASPLQTGCLVRVAARSAEAASAAVHRLVSFVPALIGDDPWQRKW
jgi:urease accessory protein